MTPDPITINDVPETVCQLWHGENCLGDITSELQLLDVRTQIKDVLNGKFTTPKLSGYYIIWPAPNGIVHHIDINTHGLLREHPMGFFDENEKYLDRLVEWK